MATMKDMWAQMIEKMADQAVEIGKLRYEKAHYEKSASHWEERALKAEQKLADSADWQVSSENNFHVYKAEQQRVICLDAKLEKALLHIERLVDELKVPNWPTITEARQFLTDQLHREPLEV